MMADGMTVEEAARDWDLAVEVVHEAQAHVEANRELLVLEAEIERLISLRGEVARGHQAVS